MKFNRFFFTAILIALLSISVFSQEPQLVDETVARVNTDIITLSALTKAKAAYKQELLAKFNNDQAKADEEYKKNENNILNILIEDRLINQRASELAIDVEAEVNQAFVRLSEQAQMSLTEFQEYLVQQNIDAEDLRKSFRTDAQRRVILFREIINPIYDKVTMEEKRAWFDSHAEIFKLPGEVTISEIFVSFEGRSEAEAAALAKQVVADARAGKSFTDLNKLYSDPKRESTKKGGLLPPFKDSDLIDYLRKLVDNMKVNDVSDPIRLDKGFQIIQLNQYKGAGLRDFTEVEQYIAQEIAFERGNGKLKDYFKKLREKSYIRIAEAYKPSSDSND